MAKPMVMHRILVAEDEPALRDLFAEALSDTGYGVATAADGQMALDYLKANPGVEVLLSDIRMPVMDGYSLAESSLKLRPELKILLMTGFDERPPKDLYFARELRTLHKPIDIFRLCALIEGMLSRP